MKLDKASFLRIYEVYPGQFHDDVQGIVRALYRGFWFLAVVTTEIMVWRGAYAKMLLGCLLLAGVTWMLWGLRRPLTSDSVKDAAIREMILRDVRLRNGG